MDKQLVKTIVGFAAGAGVSRVLGNVVKATTPYDAGNFQKVMIGIGSFAITGLVSKHVADYVDDQVELAYELVNQARNGVPKNETIVGEAHDWQG